jgi:hypothetical protein
MELAERVPEEEPVESRRYAWLEEYPLSAVMEGSREHYWE